jgi:hypothetical protein
MNFAPLDCSCQGASSEPKKIYLDFSVLEKFAKNQKIHIFGSHSKKWVQWPELLLYLNSTHPISAAPTLASACVRNPRSAFLIN